MGSLLYTGKLNEVDLLIRTGGHQRVSNFLLWQIAYSELFFTNTLWPDFKENDFIEEGQALCVVEAMKMENVQN